jgi:hypothetical protein
MKRMILPLVLALFPTPVLAQQPAVPRYAVAETATPVLNTPAFSEVFSGRVQLDPCQGVRPVEFVALPGTLFKIEAEQTHGGVTVYRVTSNDYPYRSKTGHFVDARFLKLVSEPVQERQHRLPGMVEVQQRLMAALGRPYVWGGNLKDGVPLLKTLYPNGDPLAGVDCSGLLYEATDGYTWRNTSALTGFGAAVPVAGLSADRIAQKLKPLDLIVWKGHVMVVLDGDSVIQSTMGCDGGAAGVHLSPLRDALARLMKSRKPVDDYPKGRAAAKAFVVRRWFPS